MPRKLVIQQSEFPYHITGVCINHEWFTLPMEQVWDIMSRHLYFISFALNVRIHAFTLMSNHFHLIASTPNANVSEALRHFMTNTSKDLVAAGNRTTLTYGKRNYKTILACPLYYMHAYKYVYRNPVHAGICKRVEDYPFSSLYGLLGKGPMLFPVEEDTTLFEDVEGTLAWLNEAPLEAHRLAVQRALKRSTFWLPMDKNLRTPHPLEHERL